MGKRNLTLSDADRVAKAESQLEVRYPTDRMSLAEARSWINRVAHSEDIDPPLVVGHQLPRHLLGAAVLDDHVIVVRHTRPSQLTLLHELTHCIGHEGHGSSFQRRFVELVQRHLSREHGEALASLFGHKSR